LQVFLAVAQADVPLQELMPAHFTLAAADAGATRNALVIARVRAAAAIALPLVPICFIDVLRMLLE
jgi:hypothetical protein